MKKNITEDFDFSKIKGYNIQNEYKLNPKIIRDFQDSAIMANVLGTDNFLGNHVIHSYKVPDFGKIYTIKSNLNGPLIKQLTCSYTYKRENVALYGYSEQLLLYNELKSKISEYGVSFTYQRYNTYHEYDSYLKVITQYAIELFNGIFKDCEYIDLPNCDPFKKSEANIEGQGWISDDGGIVILYNILIQHPSLSYSGSKRVKGFDHDLFEFGFDIAFFTGEVDYHSMKEYNKHIDEDFDFGKVKLKKLQDEYGFSPEVVRKINNELDLTKIIGDVIPKPYVIKPIDYPNFGKLYAPAVDLNCYLWKEFNSFMDAWCLNDKDNKRILDNAQLKLLNNPNFKFIYNTCKFKYGEPDNNDLAVILDLISEAFQTELFNHNSPNALTFGFCVPFNINTANIVCDYYISEDEGIIFINKLKINHINFKYCDGRRFDGPDNDYLVMVACYFFTNKVPYNTDVYMKINEDFDFNKVKSNKILDEYKICHPYIIKPDDLLSKLYNVKLDDASFYLKDARDYLVYVNTRPFDKDVVLSDEILKLKKKLANQLWEIATFDPKYIDKVNSIIDNIPGLEKYSSTTINQYRSEKNFYYMIYKAPFDDVYIVYGELNKFHIYNLRWLMVIYTGDVTYFPQFDNGSVNEDFDFNKVKSHNTADKEMHASLVLTLINQNLETMKKNKMLTGIMNLLKYKYSLDFSHISMTFAKCVRSSINGASLKNFTFQETQFPVGDIKKYPDEIDIAWQITQNEPNDANLRRIDNFLKNCDFVEVHPDNIIFETNSSRYEEFYNRLCEPVEYYNKWNNTTSKEICANILKCYVTKDTGIGCMLLEGRSYHLCLMFFYTGLIAYTNDNKLGTIAGINEVKDNFIKKLVSDISKEHYTKAFGWSFVYDKNGYPRIMTVISKNDHFYKVLPSIWYKNSEYTSANWSPKIYSNNPKVVMRRNSNNGLIEMGCFMPWNIESLYGQNEWLIFNRLKLRTHMTMNQFITDYKANPDNYGVYVYLLSPLGKQMFDEYIKDVIDKHLSLAKQDELFLELYIKYKK